MEDSKVIVYSLERIMEIDINISARQGSIFCRELTS